MTRYSDLMCEDIFGCTHEPETPVVEDGSNEIVAWMCRCGRYHPVPPKDTDVDTSIKSSKGEDR